jgi:hypothetical protein
MNVFAHQSFCYDINRQRKTAGGRKQRPGKEQIKKEQDQEGEER